MQPGIPLTALHGKIKQERRTLIYMDFIRKKHACLFATDIAARYLFIRTFFYFFSNYLTLLILCRGLDFPDVDWVVSSNCFYFLFYN